MKKKKGKLGSAARYGARYSSVLKQKVNKIEKIQKRPQICPQCGRKSLKRVSFAIWECSKCGLIMAGGAYSPRTRIGLAAEKIVSGKGSKEEVLSLLEEENKEEKVEA
ncbi:50S ribosomal protein L37ae [Candidatus Micrarchaeota archaeon]|nr:MAG: 50S ribosomal protein L37ae [Candidatus Micrarchaeota archaeon]